MLKTLLPFWLLFRVLVLPLLDLFEEKLDRGEICELLQERFLRMAAGCSGKVTWTDSTEAAKLMDFSDSEEPLLP